MAKKEIDLGKWGEDKAKDFLEKNGYLIIEVNYRAKYGEIDIIAKKEEILHFIEVKTRNINSIQKYGLPQEAVNTVKQNKIAKTAYQYLSETKFSGETDWQIDVIAITITDNNQIKIEHINNAFDESNLN